jgi:hypothetical protein
LIPSGFLPWNSAFSLTPHPDNSSLPLVCRLDKSLWILVAIFMGIALMIPISDWTDVRPLTPQDDSWAIAAMIALFAVPALAIAWSLIHCRIVAHKSGIAFIGFFRHQFHEWNAIEDYELRVPSSSQSKSQRPIAYLKVDGGWDNVSRNYTFYDELLQTIEREARWSKSRNWQQNDLRENGEWPKTFEYRDTSGWRLVGMYLIFTFALAGLSFFNVLTYGVSRALSGIVQNWNMLSPLGRLGMVGLVLLVFGSYPLILLTPYAGIKRRRAFLGQKIVATRQEISHFADGIETRLPWDEITSYHLETLPGNFQPSRCVVETRRHRIEFLTGITGTKTLLAVVQDRAKNAITQKWTYLNGASEDVLGGAASMWSNGQIGVGFKSHHYRTRTIRSFLIFCATMVGIFGLLIWLSYSGWGRIMSPGDAVTFIVIVTLIGLTTLFGFLAYLFNRIHCEESGLRKTGPWGERFVAWNEIEKFEFGLRGFVVTGRRSQIRFPQFVADAAGLRLEIEKRGGRPCVSTGKTQ